MGKSSASLVGAGVVGLPLALVVVFAAGSGGSAAGASSQPPVPSSVALSGIPPTYLDLYQAAAATCSGLPWTILAGIGEVASDHGRHIPSDTGAVGSMQFNPTIFATYGVDGNDDGVTDASEPADAVYSLANLLCDNGAKNGTDLQAAMETYNNGPAFMAAVLGWATTYGGLSAGSAVGGDAVETAIAFAEAQLGKPLRARRDRPRRVGLRRAPAGGLRGGGHCVAAHHVRVAAEWTPRVETDGESELPLLVLEPGDLLYSAGSDGTPLNPGHVAMYIGDDQEIEAPHTGDVVKVISVPSDISIVTRPAALLMGSWLA